MFGGKVVNVSGFRDEDKEGGFYRSYFPGAESYDITNYAGSGEVGDGAAGSLYLDLQAEGAVEWAGRFDVAFSHTVFEHIERVPRAFATYAALSRDVLITVVPFLQDEHYAPGIYGDYWRYTPMGLRSLHEENGFQVMYLSANDTPWFPVYLVAVAARDPSRHAGRLPASPWTEEARVARSTYVYPGCAW